MLLAAGLAVGCATKSDVETLQKADKDLSTRIDDNSAKTTSLGQSTADLQVNLTALKGRISLLDTQAADLDKRLQDSNQENQQGLRGVREELVMVRAQIAELKKLQSDIDQLVKTVEELRAKGDGGDSVKGATDELTRKWNELNAKYGPL